MKRTNYSDLRWILLAVCCLAAFLLLGVSQLAQTTGQFPERKGHLNDFAGAVDETTRQQLEDILENLKQKAGIDFDVAVIESTGGQEIYKFSRELASNWGVGPAARTKKSLLLVVSVNDKTSFAQISRSIQNELPEGVLGEMSQRMRGPVAAGNCNEALTAGVNYFVSKVANKFSFTAEDLNKAPSPTVESTPSPAIVNASATTTVNPIKSPEEVAPAITTPTPAQRSRTVTRNTPRDEAAVVNTGKPAATSTAEDDADESEEVELTLTEPLPQRIVKLKQFLKDYPDSKSRPRAVEILVSAYAGVGDDKLKQGDTAGGIESFMLAISEAPTTASDKLYSGVITQIPLNLYLRGERDAAVKAAEAIETKFAADPKRLVAMSGFYAGIEQPQEAARVASAVLKIAPDLADAHLALGRAMHISLRLDEAASEYRRAVELDPNSKLAQRNLADIDRAMGKSEEALTIYRRQLLVDQNDRGARAGVILSLLDLRRIDEAKGLLETALKNDSRNLPLLAGAAYWFAAHNDADAAMDLALKAVELEPRYTWAQIALARALLAQNRPLDAERPLRFARLYGHFPTLDYELATALAGSGLYDEAAEILRPTFSLKDDQLQTLLAGRTTVQAGNFIELLAAERRASIFQPTAADTEANARILKALLTFATLSQADANGGKIDEAKVIAAGKEFAAGDDAARVFRQMYVANRLLKMGIGLDTVHELIEAARTSAEAGLQLPSATLAAQADEFRDIRAHAIALGNIPDVPDAPRNVLSNLLRGRIEDLTGWTYFTQNKLDDAVNHLQRAVNTLPEGTPSWRTALWHLGTALEQSGKNEEALTYYLKSYNAADPDLGRRNLIEQVYRKVKGSTDGLDELIGKASAGAAPSASNEPSPAQSTASPESSPSTTPEATTSPESQPSPTPVTPIETAPAPTPTPEAPVETSPAPTPTPETSATPESQATPTPAPETPSPTPESQPSPTPQSSPVNNSPVGEMIAPARQTVTIVGRVRDSNNEPMANVVVVLISPQGTVLAATTDEQGNYSFTVAPSQLSYRIIPSKAGFIFQPLDKVLQSVTDDQKDLDFVGAVNKSR